MQYLVAEGFCFLKFGLHLKKELSINKIKNFPALLTFTLNRIVSVLTSVLVKSNFFIYCIKKVLISNSIKNVCLNFSHLIQFHSFYLRKIFTYLKKYKSFIDVFCRFTFLWPIYLHYLKYRTMLKKYQFMLHLEF